MNLVALVVHGLSALSVFGDVIGVRLLVTTLVRLALAVLGIASVGTAQIEAHLALPGWANYAGGVVFLLLFQAAGLSFLLSFIILSARASLTFIPIRDYQYFIDDVTQITPE